MEIRIKATKTAQKVVQLSKRISFGNKGTNLILYPTQPLPQGSHPQVTIKMAKNDCDPVKADADKVHCLLFDIRRSTRYHNRRRLFFDRVSKWTDALTAISGSGTIITVVSKASNSISIALAATTAVLSAINLVFDTKGNARLHHDFARQFINIEKVLIRSDLTAEQLEKAEEDRLDIEAGEPPALRVLDLICYNELAKAMGYGDEEMFDIKYWRAVFVNFFDVLPGSIRKCSISRDQGSLTPTPQGIKPCGKGSNLA